MRLQDIHRLITLGTVSMGWSKGTLTHPNKNPNPNPNPAPNPNPNPDANSDANSDANPDPNITLTVQ